ncbi:type VI secretion system baseplate subunit TssK [Shigella dysenteriae]|nr:type VI secretion system baseplate subunit TssK [Shigella dysenteriae]MDS1495726.1 type VI secretion system baseplate subunit TssK [Shigella dysenteriae]
MSWNNRVVWSEGQFLLPQMFQQQERYLEHVIHYRSLPLSPFYWGFNEYGIGSEALNIGKLVLTKASGVFADGTPFNAPGHTPLPPPLTILPEHLNQLIYLAVPIRTPDSEETSFDNNPESLARFSVHESETRDANSLGRGAQLLQLSHLRLRLLPEKAVTDAWIGLPDAPVVELPGVRHLPWPGWPDKMLAQAQQGQGWFWQQNSEGRYVDALRLEKK